MPIFAVSPQKVLLLTANVTKIVHCVEKFIFFNLLKSELPYIAIRFRMAAQQSRLVREKRRFFDFNWLPWQRPLRNQKRRPDRPSTNIYLSFGAKIVKIGPVIIKKERKKLMPAKYIALPASLPSGLNKLEFHGTRFLIVSL